MEIKEAYERIVTLSNTIEQLGLRSRNDSWIGVNFAGDEVYVHLVASEEYHPKGFWKRDFSRSTSCAKLDEVLQEAARWVVNLPTPERRAIESAMKKIKNFLDDLPAGTSPAHDAIYSSLRVLLEAEADKLAKNILPAPEPMPNIDHEPLPGWKNATATELGCKPFSASDDDEIPY